MYTKAATTTVAAAVRFCSAFYFLRQSAFVLRNSAVAVMPRRQRYNGLPYLS